jgi:hypothetical protein
MVAEEIHWESEGALKSCLTMLAMINTAGPNCPLDPMPWGGLIGAKGDLVKMIVSCTGSVGTLALARQKSIWVNSAVVKIHLEWLCERFHGDRVVLL